MRSLGEEESDDDHYVIESELESPGGAVRMRTGGEVESRRLVHDVDHGDRGEDDHGDKPLLSHLGMASLALWWCVYNLFWASMTLIMLPERVEVMVAEHSQGSMLGVILLVGAVVSLVVSPIVGAISDRYRGRWGRRKPFLVVGVGGTVLFMVGLAWAGAKESLPMFMLMWFLVVLCLNVAQAPYSAVIPDVVHADQFGAASGWMGFMQMLGNAVGGALGLAYASLGTAVDASSGFVPTCGIVAVGLVAGTLVAVLVIRDPPLPPASAEAGNESKRTGFVADPTSGRHYVVQVVMYLVGEFLAPFRSANFVWVFWTRFLMTCGLQSVQQFIQYYMRDVIKPPYAFFSLFSVDEPEQATSCFVLPLLMGAIVASLLAGRLSDRYGRKSIVYISGVLTAIPPLAMTLFRSFPLTVMLGFVFGLGLGAYAAVDWALASDTLPSAKDHAKDMGVWQFSMSVPQVFVPLIAGGLLDGFQSLGRDHGHDALGYDVVFLIAVTFFSVSTLLVRNVRLPPKQPLDRVPTTLELDAIVANEH